MHTVNCTHAHTKKEKRGLGGLWLVSSLNAVMYYRLLQEQVGWQHCVQTPHFLGTSITKLSIQGIAELGSVAEQALCMHSDLELQPSSGRDA